MRKVLIAISLTALMVPFVGPALHARPVKKLSRRSNAGNYGISVALYGRHLAETATDLTPYNQYRTTSDTLTCDARAATAPAHCITESINRWQTRRSGTSQSNPKEHQIEPAPARQQSQRFFPVQQIKLFCPTLGKVKIADKFVAKWFVFACHVAAQDSLDHFRAHRPQIFSLLSILPFPTTPEGSVPVTE